MTGRIVAVSGPSGAGKTTVARLLARSFVPSVHIQMDAFTPFVVNGWIDPWRAEATHQNDVLGGAVASAAIQFAVGGYSVILDGHVFPEAVDGLAEFCARRDVALHYVVLRADLDTCLGRIRHRLAHPVEASTGRAEYADYFDVGAIAQQHARFLDLGRYEANVIRAVEAPEHVARAVLDAFDALRRT